MRCKSVLSAAIGLLLCLYGFTVSAHGADDPHPADDDAASSVMLSLSVPQTQIFAGDVLAVTMTLRHPLRDVVSFDWQLRFDGALFVLQSAEVGDSHADMRVSRLKHDADGAYYSVSYVDKTSRGVTLNAGTVCVLTFRAADDPAADQTAAFSLVSEGVYDARFAPIAVQADERVSVFVQRVLPEKLVLDKLPEQTSYRYREALNTTGMELSLVYNNGKQEPVRDGFVCTPTSFTVRSGLPMFGLRGEVPVTVSYAGLQTAFSVRVYLTPWQWLIKIALFGWLWY